jgi:DNA gyrase subunit A
VRDESDENTRIVIELKRGEQGKVVVNQLFQKTALESSFGVTLLAIDKKRPKQMNIKELIDCYIDHRREVLTRRTQYRLKQAEDRAHILEGYKIALDNLDDFVRIIRASANRDDAREKLMARYPLTERQTNAILDLRLYQLTGLERDKIEQEYAELMKIIDELRAILASDELLRALVKKELLDLKPKYSQPRRTEILAAEGEFRMEDVIANEGCIVTVTHAGMIKRTPVAEYRAQRRGGKGIIGTDTYEEDFVERLFTASTHDYVLFFTSTGQCLAKKVYDIPEGARTAKGKSVSSFLRLGEGDTLAAMICVKEFSDQLHLTMATRNGVTKKTNLADYANATREGGLRGIKLEPGDTLVGCVLTNGTNEIIIVSHKGQAVRFKEEGLRDQGRDTVGVTGMRFKIEGDYVQAIEVCDPDARLLVAREDGIGKRTPFEDYRLISRGGTGVIAIDLPDDGSVSVAGALSVRDDDEIMLLTAKGQSVRTRVKEIRETGRGAKGVKLVDLGEGDKLLALARVVEVKGEETSEESAGSPPEAGDEPPPSSTEG